MDVTIDFINGGSGRQLVEHLGSFLIQQGVRFDAIFSSSENQALHSAETLANKVHVAEVIVDRRLQKLEQLDGTDPTSEVIYRCQQRMLHAVHSYTKVYEKRRIAVVGHPDQFALGAYALEHAALALNASNSYTQEYLDRVFYNAYHKEGTLWRLRFDGGLFRGREIIYPTLDQEGHMKSSEKR